MAQWVTLHPPFEVCARETWYEGGRIQEGGLVASRGDRKKIRSTLKSSWETKSRSRGGENDMQ